jgi:hypothetical protein
MRTFAIFIVSLTGLLVGCGDSGGSGGTAGSGGSGGSGAGGSGGTGGASTVSSEDIAAYCAAIDACWDDADACTTTFEEAPTLADCTADLTVLFDCIEAAGTLTVEQCDTDTPCLTDAMTAYECLGFK